MSAASSTLTNTIALTDTQKLDYQRDGFLVLRGALDNVELARLDAAIDRHVPVDAYAPGKVYPDAAKYTLSQQVLADPDMAYIAEHPKVLGPVEEILGQPAHLTAYVVYVRTPGDVGSKMHNDYKRWRPVGSSMDWLFSIVPLTDFDDAHGPLLVAPGSHQLQRVTQEALHLWTRSSPDRPDENDFIDPELRRGDLLLMNMYTWHWAPPNAGHRIGVFNKYAAADAPPATGYYLYGSDVRDAFSEEGGRVLAAFTDKPLLTTRLMLTHGDAVLMQRGDDGRWQLPGGAGWEEESIPGWDHGSRIGALEQVIGNELALSLPWVSYVGDYDETWEGEAGLCRLYGHPCAQKPLLSDQAKAVCGWVSREELAGLRDDALAHAFAADALTAWLDAPLRRGKGLSQARCAVDQYAA
ncbi:MAG: phytanoyl-CoA dioxygenase family protein [Pseudomonadota bacterium]